MTRCRRRKFNYDQMNDVLIKEFPSLAWKYQQELDWWGDETPGPHIIYGDLFTPYLANQLKAGNNGAAQKAFRHLEGLLNHEDVKVQEVAVVTVLEYLQNDAELLALATPYLGPLAAEAITDLKTFWEGIRG